MKKKLIVFILTAVCLMTLFQGCTDTKNPPSSSPSSTPEITKSEEGAPSATVMPELVPDENEEDGADIPDATKQPQNSPSTGTGAGDKALVD